MGSAQSFVTPEVALTTALVAGAIGIGYNQMSHGSSSSATATAGTPTGKKGKKKKSTEPPSSESVPALVESKSRPTPVVIPGEFDTSTVSTPTPAVVEKTQPKLKKSKKKKRGKSSAASTAATGATALDASSAAGYHSDSSAEHPQPKSKRSQSSSPSSSQMTGFQSTILIDTDGSWTRVGSIRRKQHAAGAASTSEGPSGPSADPTTSDAGLTTSLTGNSSPIADRTEDEGLLHNSREGPETRRPLAERLPKPRKTGVDDMLETPDYPTVSRVMRVQPLPNEKPASGFSWGDYEDVHTVDNVGGGNEADGEDDGWGIVKSKTRSRADRPASTQIPAQKAPETMTKRQRQNASKREALKSAKAQGEAERLAILAKHKRELENVRMADQFRGKAPGGKVASGGMKATVDERGKLVWE